MKEKVPKPKKAARQSSKKPPIPKVRDMRKIVALRVILWALLGFVFVRGLLAILFPTDTQRLFDRMSSSIEQVNDRIVPTDEASAFAESFALDYFTYDSQGIADYKIRIGRYCDDGLTGDICDGLLLRGNAKARYTSAVKIVPYSDRQMDITVQVVADYTSIGTEIVNGTETEKEVVLSSNTYLTVPVYLSPNGGYLVEDMPLVTAPPRQSDDYQTTAYAATAADERIKKLASVMLEDFFKTLFSEEQRRIDYYLTEDANRQRLREIDGTMKFDRLETISVYVDGSTNGYTCIVALRLADPGGSTVKQRFNISLVENGSRMYVRDINLRSHNLRI